MSSAKKSTDLTFTLTINKPPQEVFAAINNVAAWWIGEVHGDARKVGSQFTYSYKDFHKSTQRVTELVPNEKIVWKVEDAFLKFTQDKREWTGTHIVFEISARGEQTEIKFTHRGLTPEVECFEACSAGWEFYVKKSLKNLLLHGKGLAPSF